MRSVPPLPHRATPWARGRPPARRVSTNCLTACSSPFFDLMGFPQLTSFYLSLKVADRTRCQSDLHLYLESNVSKIPSLFFAPFKPNREQSRSGNIGWADPPLAGEGESRARQGLRSRCWWPVEKTWLGQVIENQGESDLGLNQRSLNDRLPTLLTVGGITSQASPSKSFLSGACCCSLWRD